MYTPLLTGQHIYPRRHIFEQACGVLAEAGTYAH